MMTTVTLSPRGEEALLAIGAYIQEMATSEDSKILAADDQIVNQALFFLKMSLANIAPPNALRSAATLALHDARETGVQS